MCNTEGGSGSQPAVVLHHLHLRPEDGNHSAQSVISISKEDAGTDDSKYRRVMC